MGGDHILIILITAAQVLPKGELLFPDLVG